MSLGTYFLLVIAMIALFFILLGSIPATIASKKGYSRLAFFIFGFFCFLPALIVSIVISDKKKQDQVQNADLMLKYKKMLDEGIITEEEYLQKKEELLKL